MSELALESNLQEGCSILLRSVEIFAGFWGYNVKDVIL